MLNHHEEVIKPKLRDTDEQMEHEFSVPMIEIKPLAEFLHNVTTINIESCIGSVGYAEPSQSPDQNCLYKLGDHLWELRYVLYHSNFIKL